MSLEPLTSDIRINGNHDEAHVAIDEVVVDSIQFPYIRVADRTIGQYENEYAGLGFRMFNRCWWVTVMR